MTCGYEGCDKRRQARGLCEAHWKQQRKGKELKPLRPRAFVPKGASCIFAECGRPRNAQGYCKTHYVQWQRRGADGLRSIGVRVGSEITSCSGPDCDRPAQKLNLCGSHYAQKRRGAKLTQLRAPQECGYGPCDKRAIMHGLCSGHGQQRKRGVPLAPLWDRKARCRVVTNGYIIIMDHSHPNARKSGYVFEHVVVMSQMLGRPLFKDENVHHINGVRDDNRPGNLELWSTSQPCGQRVEDKLAWAREIIARYESLPAEVRRVADVPV